MQSMLTMLCFCLRHFVCQTTYTRTCKNLHFSLLLGIMAPTWLMSIWIGNLAVTSMMLVIVEAVLEQLEKMREAQNDGDITLGGYACRASSTTERNHSVTDQTKYERVRVKDYGEERTIINLSVGLNI